MDDQNSELMSEIVVLWDIGEKMMLSKRFETGFEIKILKFKSFSKT